MIDIDAVRRDASRLGHQEFAGPDDACPACGLSADDMLKLGRIPLCEAGRWTVRRSANGRENNRLPLTPAECLERAAGVREALSHATNEKARSILTAVAEDFEQMATEEYAVGRARAPRRTSQLI